MSRYYPILLDLEGARCVVVGGGQVAERKVGSLLEAGAAVRLVSPEAVDALAGRARRGQIEWTKEKFGPAALEGAALVIAATGDNQVNRAVSDEARRRHIPVNVVDQPELCTFIVPSVVRRGDLVIAISTSGKSPAVSRRVRRQLEAQFGEEWAAYLVLMGEARQMAMNRIGDQKRREEIFNALAGAGLLEMIRRGDLEAARSLVKELTGA